ncbi:MAG: LppX_LprAFG lipoprotein [Ardenticatenales bacterium]|nr:LppX_LprAFG lipoprotein [Ardenticatenales bacterium]
MKQSSLLLIVLLLLVGCSGFGEPTPVPTPTPTPRDILEQAVQRWNETKAFHFTLDLAERTIALDGTGTLAFAKAQGDVVAPDSMQAVALVRSPLGSMEVGLIAIGEQQWLTNPLNGKWEEAPAEFQTDVTGLFDAEQGIGSLLLEMENLERAADETVNEIPSIHLRGSMPGATLSTFAADLAEIESVQVELWISSADQRIHKVVITEPAKGDKIPIWTFLFSQFDDVAPIEPPL